MKQLRKLSFLMMAMFVAVVSLSFTSCSDDDDTVSDYSITCTAACDGYTAEQLEALQQQLNEAASQVALSNLTESQAILVFDNFISRYRQVLANGDSSLGSNTLVLTYRLVNNGSVVKSTVVTVTSTGCTVG